MGEAPKQGEVAKKMIAAFFHDERFSRDASGRYYSTGALPYRTFARYLRHFDRIIVVGRLDEARGNQTTLASGEGVEWDCIPSSGLSRTGYWAAMFRRIRSVLARVDCAILRMPSLIASAACREALVSNTPWMVEVVGDAFEALWNHGSWFGKASALPMYLINRYQVRRAAFATYVTRATLQRRYPPGGAWVSASNVMIASPQEEVLERRIARIEGMEHRRLVVLGLVGSYDVDYKGHETALRALSILKMAALPVMMRFIGTGDPSRWRAHAKALGVHGLVDFGGVLPQGEPVLRWMDELDLCLVPSLTEGLPRCLVEAMSRALPAVGSNTGGIPELLEARWLHRRGDHRGLARVVRNMIARREEMKAQACRNWQAAFEFASDLLEARRDALVQQFKTALRENEAG